MGGSEIVGAEAARVFFYLTFLFGTSVYTEEKERTHGRLLCSRQSSAA